MARATRYLARQAASTARVRAVLVRAVERAVGREEADAAATAALVDPVLARLARAGLLDDAAFARMKSRRLIEQGRSAPVIRATLRFHDGVDPREPAFDASLAALDPTAQALRFAQRRRLGPFRLTPRPEKRDADIASLARAGFEVSVARRVIDGEGFEAP